MQGAGVPDRKLERMLGTRVCGVDEAGRGPLAGPVVAAAVILPPRLARGLSAGIDDSKKLTRERREELYAGIRDCCLVGVGEASVAEIDRLNIFHAAMLAMQRAVAALPEPPDHAIIDGNRCPALGCAATAVVEGDARCISVAAASIVAKVTRDRFMVALAAEHPGYGWENNVGYATPEHVAALKRLGRTPHHRAFFAPVEQLELDFVDAAD
jgi:ribonuclease HII